MLAIGIDSGTQSTKSIVLDLESGKIIASAQKSYELIGGLPEGHMEQHPEDWISAVEETVEECLHQLPDRKRVVCIGISGQQHGLVALDAEGRVIRPAKLWCDTSTVSQCRDFENAFGGMLGLIELAGNAMLPGYTAPKILWLKQNEPENFNRAATFLLPHDYINFRLTGAKTMEYGDASGTGLLDVRKREWCRPLCDFISGDLTEHMPEPGSSRGAAGKLKPDLAAKWGLSADVIISAGGGDNMMGAIGTGNTRPGVLTASLGTSGTLYACAEQPVIDPAGEVAAFCDSNDRWLPLVCTMNVTVATEQARALFGWNHSALEEAVSSVPAGAGGLLFLPYLNGERTPSLPDGSGVLHGLTTSNMTPAHIARAVMEGATLGLAYGMDRFRKLGVKTAEIRLTGGGSKSPVWRQIAADVFGVSTVCLHSAEGAALGAAIQAWVASERSRGNDVMLDDATARYVSLDESTRTVPDPAKMELYAALLGRQTKLTRVLHESGNL